MSLSLKPLEEQTLVITGASSGIGLATAKLAARRGANVVLVSRDPDDIEAAADEVRAEGGGHVLTVVADVADRAGVEYVAQQAEKRFGGFDTWVNNAATSIYGRLTETPPEDARQLFETNYWGVVHGSEVAVDRFRRRADGSAGALINVGSIFSERAIPLQGHYSASKHAVKAYTEALRMELEEEGLPVSVTLVKPSAVATPYPEHARNLMDEEPTLPGPAYAPEVVAETILHCAGTPVRDIVVGGKGKVQLVLGDLFPRLMDKVMEATMFDQQRKDEPARHHEGALHEPTRDGASTRSRTFEGRVMERSPYTAMALHPGLTLLGVAALAVGVGYLAAR